MQSMDPEQIAQLKKYVDIEKENALTTEDGGFDFDTEEDKAKKEKIEEKIEKKIEIV